MLLVFGQTLLLSWIPRLPTDPVILTPRVVGGCGCHFLYVPYDPTRIRTCASRLDSQRLIHCTTCTRYQTEKQHNMTPSFSSLLFHSLLSLLSLISFSSLSSLPYFILLPSLIFSVAAISFHSGFESRSAHQILDRKSSSLKPQPNHHLNTQPLWRPWSGSKLTGEHWTWSETTEQIGKQASLFMYKSVQYLNANILSLSNILHYNLNDCITVLLGVHSYLGGLETCIQRHLPMKLQRQSIWAVCKFLLTWWSFTHPIFKVQQPLVGLKVHSSAVWFCAVCCNVSFDFRTVLSNRWWKLYRVVPPNVSTG